MTENTPTIATPFPSTITMSSGNHHQITLRQRELPTQSKEGDQKLVKLVEDNVGGNVSDMDDGVEKTNRSKGLLKLQLHLHCQDGKEISCHGVPSADWNNVVTGSNEVNEKPLVVTLWQVQLSMGLTSRSCNDWERLQVRRQPQMAREKQLEEKAKC